MARQRKALSKKLRFEVFKRDSFKCRYCGRSPLDHPVILELDHVIPHCDGGRDDIVNLVTACKDCNSGKSDRRLSDDALLKQTVSEMEAIQERQNQIKQMVQWRQSLVDESLAELNAAHDFWNGLTPGWSVSEVGLRKLKQTIAKFGLQQVLAAMQVCSVKYLVFDQDGNITSDSWVEAFSYIPRVCSVDEQEKKHPGMQKVHYVKGILRKRFIISPWQQSRLIERIKVAVENGVPVDEAESKAKTSPTLNSFCRWLDGGQYAP
jgi:hypothetical protein